MAPKKRKPSAYNLHVGREMRRGLSMAQAAKSWKKKGSKAKPSRKRVARKAPRRKSRKLAKKKTTRRRRKKGFDQNKIFSALRTLAFVGPGVAIAIETASTPKDRAQRIMESYTGYNMADKNFYSGKMINTYKPFVAVSLLSYGLPKIMSFVKGVI
jgi:hypothetical protein